MKKSAIFLAVCMAVVFAGCTDFGSENSVNLPEAPTVSISDVLPVSDSKISFTVAPESEAGYYSWLVVESEIADSTISATNILKLLDKTGVESGMANYAVLPDTVVEVSGLTPFTVYQIYAVASSKDGVVSPVAIAQVRTLDDGSKPTPTKFALSDTTVTLTFHEPLQLGEGKVFVSYFAKNTLSGPTLAIKPGKESFNPQDVEVPESSLSVDGNDLVIELPGAHAGAYASVTYEAGAVLDLEGNLSSAYTRKADTLVSGAPVRGITVHLANETWALYSEFEETNLDTVATFAVWDDLVMAALPDLGVTIGKKVATITPTVIYNEKGKKTTIDVTTWGTIGGIPAFLLPEEPVRGAVVDLNIPAGAYEDVYGNTSTALAVEGNYLYSYGYTLADILGKYEIIGISSSTGNPFSKPDTVSIVEYNNDTVLIQNLAKGITGQDSEIEGIFDPVGGTLTVPDWQILVVDWTHPTAGTADVIFSTYNSPAIVFSVTSSGEITSASDIWGYYFAKDETYIGALRWYDPSSQWTRFETIAPAPAPRKAQAGHAVKVKPKSLSKKLLGI